MNIKVYWTWIYIVVKLIEYNYYSSKIIEDYYVGVFNMSCEFQFVCLKGSNMN